LLGYIAGEASPQRWQSLKACLASGRVRLSERLSRDIRRAIRKQYSAEEKIRIVLDGLRGEITIAELCRREGIAESLYYSWSKEFLEAGNRRSSRHPFCALEPGT
jgi:transposase-like protein